MAGKSSIQEATTQVSGRLSKADRRRQLLDMALVIIREEGADRLTLGHLALRAGVSKPITYEHFSTRAGLLIALYKLLDQNQTQVLNQALIKASANVEDTVQILASTYIHCSADTSGEWHALGAALSGSEEMVAVQQELIQGYVQLFVSALAPHSALPNDELHRRGVGIIGAGEALSKMMLSGQCSEQQAAKSFSALIRGALNGPESSS